MRIEELQSSLWAQELRLTERNSKKELEQALKASFGKKSQKQAWLENKKEYDGGVQKSELSNSDKKHQNIHKGKEKFDKRKVWCYSCNKFGHFTIDYWSNKVRKGEPMLLMVSENVGGSMVDRWYMDTSCSNNLTRNKQWLVDFDFGKMTKIKCVGDEYLNAKMKMSKLR